MFILFLETHKKFLFFQAQRLRQKCLSNSGNRDTLVVAAAEDQEILDLLGGLTDQPSQPNEVASFDYKLLNS